MFIFSLGWQIKMNGSVCPPGLNTSMILPFPMANAFIFIKYGTILFFKILFCYDMTCHKFMLTVSMITAIQKWHLPNGQNLPLIMGW